MSDVADRQPRTASDPVSDDPITRWLLMVGVLIALMVVVGGFVRLSRAGLSIVEWDVVTGIVPPISDAAWEQSFADYQQTPEYQIMNSGMSLSDYQRIFYIEWAHRLIARIVGLLVVLPLLWFMWKGRLSVKQSLRYWAIAILFGLQGAMGWVMVSSGLRDRPVVSHFRLTIHLIAALALLGLVLWMALDRIQTARPSDRRSSSALGNTIRYLTWALLASVVVQMAYGGLVAGSRSGYVSNTWPLLFGRIIPYDLLTTHEPWLMNLFKPLGSLWIHRWLAFVVAIIAVAAYMAVRRGNEAGSVLRSAAGWMLVVVTLQIALGVTVVLLGVPKWFALAHQAIGVILFSVSVVITHQVGFRSESRRAPISAILQVGQ